MRHKLGLLSSLGLSFISTLTWGEETSTVLETIRVQAESTREDVSQNSSATKFTHDVLDVPFNRAYLSKQIMEQQDVQRIDDALTLVSGFFIKIVLVVVFGITTHFVALVPTPI